MRTFLSLSILAAAGLSSSLYACSSSPETPVVDGGGGGSDASSPETSKPDSGKPDGGNTGPGSSCADPIPVELGKGLEAAFKTAGQSIYFSVKATAGTILQMSADTAATPDSTDVVDTTISVFDATGKTLLANVDDAFPRATTDAQLYYRSVAEATLCVQVTDFATWKGEAPQLADDSAFTFLAGALSNSFDFVTLDQEPNDSIGAPQTGKLKPFSTPPGAFSVLAGVLQGAADVDVYKFTVPVGATSFGLAAPPIGAPVTDAKSSYGSTLARFTATVKTLDGTIVGELAPPSGNVESMSDQLTVPVTAGDYYLHISRPAGITAGANDFYATFLDFSTSNPVEAEVTSGGNDSLGTAEPITMTVDKADAKKKHGFILAYLPAGDPMDNFSFPVATGDSVSLSCGALRNGSGLQDFKAEFFVGGASLQNEVEGATKDLAWSGSPTASKPAVAVTAGGTGVLQLSAASRSATNKGTYYLCGVHVTSP